MANTGIPEWRTGWVEEGGTERGGGEERESFIVENIAFIT